MLLQRFPQCWQCLAECQQAGVFVGIADFAPACVIAVLLASAGIAAGCLQMAVGEWADPHVGIGGRHCQGIDPGHLSLVADALALAVEIAELATQLAAADARHAVVDIAQVGG